jgi:hypothetical protein
MGQVISTVDTQADSVKNRKDKNLEIKDFPISETDQSKVCSTHTIVPHKRKLEKEDVEKFVNRVKGNKEKKENKTNKKTTKKE